MEDASFLYFTQDEIIKQINIDPGLIDSFKRVMVKLQKYFNDNGYTSQRNYKEFLEKYLLNSGNKNFRFYFDKISRPGVNGYYEKDYNAICINEKLLNKEQEKLDGTLCHEFIHFLVMHELKKDNSDEDIYDGGFINEALTELLTQQMYPNSTAYDAQTAMHKYSNLLSGHVNKFGRFLQGSIDSKYSSYFWEDYRRHTKRFQLDFDNNNYINLRQAQSNSNFINAQRSLINLFIEPKNNKNISEYIEDISMLLERPVEDTKYINDVVFKTMDEKLLSSLKINDIEIINFLKDKITKIRNLLIESHERCGRKTYAFEFEGRKLILDENGKVNGKYTQVSHSPRTGEIGITINGKKKLMNMNDIDFVDIDTINKPKINQLSSYFNKESLKDLQMIGQALHHQGQLTKIEKIILPGISTKDNTIIYLATYGNKVIILGNSTQIGYVENNELCRYTGFTSQNPENAALCYDSLGKIENGILFSTLSAKHIYNRSIEEYRKQLEDTLTPEEISKLIEEYKKKEDVSEESEDEIRHYAIHMFAQSNFDKLSQKEKDEFALSTCKQAAQFIISTKDGKIDVSIKFKDNVSFIGKSEVLYDSTGLGMYNKEIESISKNITQDISSDKNTLILDENGNIPFQEAIIENSKVQNDPQEELKKLNVQIDSLKNRHEIIVSQINSLIKQNQQTLLINYLQQYEYLVKQRDLLSEQINNTVLAQEKYQQIIDTKREMDHKEIISQVEKLLKIHISSNSELFYNSITNTSPETSKDASSLRKEQGLINTMLDKLYDDGDLDLIARGKMKLEIDKEYNILVSKATNAKMLLNNKIKPLEKPIKQPANSNNNSELDNKNQIIIQQIETLLGWKISSYYYNYSTSKLQQKNKSQLSQELGTLTKIINNLYNEDFKIDVTTRNQMAMALLSEFNKMIKNAPSPVLSNTLSNLNDESTYKSK